MTWEFVSLVPRSTARENGLGTRLGVCGRAGLGTSVFMVCLFRDTI